MFYAGLRKGYIRDTPLKYQRYPLKISEIPPFWFTSDIHIHIHIHISKSVIFPGLELILISEIPPFYEKGRGAYSRSRSVSVSSA